MLEKIVLDKPEQFCKDLINKPVNLGEGTESIGTIVDAWTHQNQIHASIKIGESSFTCILLSNYETP